MSAVARARRPPSPAFLDPPGYARHRPYSVFDRLSQIRQADIVSSKRLGSVLTMAREAQLATKERRSKSCPARPFPSASSMQ